MSTTSPRPTAATRQDTPCDIAARPAAPSLPTADDLQLRERVMARLSQTALRRLDIQIHVQDGLVRLCGSLRDARLRAHAEWLVFTTEGVQAVCSDWQLPTSATPQYRH